MSLFHEVRLLFQTPQNAAPPPRTPSTRRRLTSLTVPRFAPAMMSSNPYRLFPQTPGTHAGKPPPFESPVHHSSSTCGEMHTVRDRAAPHTARAWRGGVRACEDARPATRRQGCHRGSPVPPLFHQHQMSREEQHVIRIHDLDL